MNMKYMLMRQHPINTQKICVVFGKFDQIYTIIVVKVFWG